MEQVGDGEINSNDDIAEPVVNEFKVGGNGGDDHTAIARQVSAGGISASGSLVLDDIVNNDVGSAIVLGEKKTNCSKKKRNLGSNKPPDAPKRFKSSFIFFSMAKHREIKKRLALGGDTKVTNITSMVSEAWRALEPLERQKFEEMARQDKLRYDIERKNYIPPNGMSLTSKRKRNPDAPKRPKSAYLSYANKLRGKVKSENPDCSNGEISKILSSMWKGMADEERKKYKDTEQMSWDIYREKMEEWKKNNDGRKKGTKIAVDLHGKTSSKKSKKSKENDNVGSINFSSHSVDDTDGDVDEQLLGLGGVPEMDTNPNTDEMIAASALRGVREGPQQHLGVGAGDISQNIGYSSFCGVNVTNGMHSTLSVTPAPGQPGIGQIDMSGLPHNHHGYPLGGSTHAMIMAQFRGPVLMPIDQQANLSQLASLAGVQNDAMRHHQQQLQPRMDQPVSETGMNTDIDNRKMGNSVLNDNSGGDKTSF